MEEKTVVIYRKTAAVGKTEDLYYLKDEEHYTVSKNLILSWMILRGTTEGRAIEEIFNTLHSFHMISEKFNELAERLTKSFEAIKENFGMEISDMLVEDIEDDAKDENPINRGCSQKLSRLYNIITYDYKPP